MREALAAAVDWMMVSGFFALQAYVALGGFGL